MTRDLIARAEKALAVGSMEELHGDFCALPSDMVIELIAALREAERTLSARDLHIRALNGQRDSVYAERDALRSQLAESKLVAKALNEKGADIAAESEKLWAVAEAVQASLDGSYDWLETYCDVGAPDDCDHCVIVNALAALPERKPAT